MVVGIGRFTAPSTAEIKTAEDAEDAEDFDFFLAAGCAEAVGGTLAEDAKVFPLFTSASSASSAVFSCFGFFFCPLVAAFFLSSFATASASQAAFSFPPPAGRLLHSADPASPAIWARLRPLSTDSS